MSEEIKLQKFLVTWGGLSMQDLATMNKTLQHLAGFVSPFTYLALLNDPSPANSDVKAACANYVSHALQEIGCATLDQLTAKLSTTFKVFQSLYNALEAYLEFIKSTKVEATVNGLLLFLLEDYRMVLWRDIVNVIEPAPFESASSIEITAPVTLLPAECFGLGTYQDSFQIVRTLRDYLNRCFALYHAQDTRYYSPYVVICQSSGYGKTRLCIETGKWYVVFYICGRSDRRGENPTTVRISDYVKKERNPNVIFWTTLIYSMIYVYYFEIAKNVDNGDSYRWLIATIFQQDAQNEFWQKVINLHRLLMQKMPTFSENISYRKIEYYLSEWFCDVNYEIPQMSKETYLQSLPRALEAAINDETPFNLSGPSYTVPYTLPSQDRSLFSQFKSSSSDEAKILLVIDEASYFFLGDESNMSNITPAQSYIYFRRALTCIDRLLFPTMTVLIDTNIRIANYPPIYPYDRSSRFAAEGTVVFLPFHCLPKELNNFEKPFPLLSDDYKILLSPYGDITNQCIWNPFLLAKNSRILFARESYYFIQHRRRLTPRDIFEYSYKEVITLAMKKLIHSPLFDKKFMNSDSFQKGYGLFAIAASRYNLSSTIRATQEILVQHHLASILDISDDRNQNFRIAYPSEPILAEAALQLSLRYLKTQYSTLSVFYYVLRNLKSMLRNSEILVSSNVKGEIAELLACILLSRAFDITLLLLTKPENTSYHMNLLRSFSSSDSKVFTKPIPLFRMLESLFSPRHYQRIINSMKDHYQPTFFYALLQYNHFIQVEYSIKKEHLLYYLLRSAAIVSKNGEAGIDIIIPLAIPLEQTIPVNLLDESTFRISALIVHTQNWNNDYDIEDLATKLSTSSVATSIGFSSTSPDQMFFMINMGTGKCAPKYRNAPCLPLKVVNSERLEVDVSTDLVAQEILKTKVDVFIGEKKTTNYTMTRQNTRQLEHPVSTPEPPATTLSFERRVIICQKFNISQENYRFLEPEEVEILQEIQAIDSLQTSTVETLKIIGRSNEYIEKLTRNLDNGKNPPV